MLKYTQTIRWQMPTNCLSVFENFVGLALKGLKGGSGAVFFCEFCEVFKNNYFLEHIRTAASNLSSSVFGKFLICNILDSHFGNAQFSPVFPHEFISTGFKFCATSDAYLEHCQKSIMEHFCEYS